MTSLWRHGMLYLFWYWEKRTLDISWYQLDVWGGVHFQVCRGVLTCYEKLSEMRVNAKRCRIRHSAIGSPWMDWNYVGNVTRRLKPRLKTWLKFIHVIVSFILEKEHTCSHVAEYFEWKRSDTWSWRIYLIPTTIQALAREFYFIGLFQSKAWVKTIWKMKTE